MDISQKPKSILRSALWKLFIGDEKYCGKQAKLKSLILLSVFLFPYAFYGQIRADAVDFSGEIPPKTQVIYGTGTITKKQSAPGSKHIYFEFLTDKGISYKTQGTTAFRGADDLSKRNPPAKVFVRGFLLRNGEGAFYFLSVVDLTTGRVLTDQDRAMKGLYQIRHNYVLWIALIVGTTIFGGISILNTLKIRNKLLAGE